MIHFNELFITPDRKHLIIDVSVKSDKYYKDVYIDSIVIDNQDTYVGTGPSTTPVYEFTIPTEGTVTLKKLGKTITPTYNYKHWRLELSTSDLTTSSFDGIFFVYVRTKGTPAANTPCGMDNITTMNTLVDLYPYYQQGMQFIREVGNTCSIPRGFIDHILKLKKLELAVRTGHYPEAIETWKKFFGNSRKVVTKPCSCNGNT